MIDLYIRATDMPSLVAGLATVPGLTVDGEPCIADHGHSLCVVSDTADGVTLAVRCRDDALAAQIAATGLEQVEKPGGWSWAGS